MAVNRSHKKKNIQDHVVAEADIPDGGKAYQGEIHSDVHLEDDLGSGKGVVIRFFDFKANPESFRKCIPTKQELFSAHRTQLLGELWQDELEPMEEVEPRVIISKDKTGYRIIVGAQARRGSLIHTKPTTLKEIANDSSKNSG